jgi:hypothetical protein
MFAAGHEWMGGCGLVGIVQGLWSIYGRWRRRDVKGWKWLKWFQKRRGWLFVGLRPLVWGVLELESRDERTGERVYKLEMVRCGSGFATGSAL